MSLGRTIEQQCDGWLESASRTQWSWIWVPEKKIGNIEEMESIRFDSFPNKELNVGMDFLIWVTKKNLIYLISDENQ